MDPFTPSVSASARGSRQMSAPSGKPEVFDRLNRAGYPVFDEGVYEIDIQSQWDMSSCVEAYCDMKKRYDLAKHSRLAFLEFTMCRSPHLPYLPPEVIRMIHGFLPTFQMPKCITVCFPMCEWDRGLRECGILVQDLDTSFAEILDILRTHVHTYVAHVSRVTYHDEDEMDFDPIMSFDPLDDVKHESFEGCDGLTIVLSAYAPPGEHVDMMNQLARGPHNMFRILTRGFTEEEHPVERKELLWTAMIWIFITVMPMYAFTYAFTYI